MTRVQKEVMKYLFKWWIGTTNSVIKQMIAKDIDPQPVNNILDIIIELQDKYCGKPTRKVVKKPRKYCKKK